MPIVTPNWNLPTPALTDAYNLVGDLATFSSAVDGAITSVANAFKGTSAQRIAAASTSVDGVLWQDTDGIKMIWRRDGSVSGQWAPAVARWIGTTAQMNAFSQAPNGFSWYSTTDSREHFRVGGAWIVQGSSRRGGSGVTPAIANGGSSTLNITFTPALPTTPTSSPWFFTNSGRLNVAITAVSATGMTVILNNWSGGNASTGTYRWGALGD